MSLKKGQKQGRDERTQKLPYICCVFLQMSGSLLGFFHLCLVSVLFSGPPLTEMKFYRIFFPSCHIVSHWNVSLCEEVEEEVENAVFKVAWDLGYSTLKPEQLQVVCTVFRGCDVFAVLPTGFGKSLCFAYLLLVLETQDWYCWLFCSNSHGRWMDALSIYNAIANASIHKYLAKVCTYSVCLLFGH